LTPKIMAKMTAITTFFISPTFQRLQYANPRRQAKAQHPYRY